MPTFDRDKIVEKHIFPPLSTRCIECHLKNEEAGSGQRNRKRCSWPYDLVCLVEPHQKWSKWSVTATKPFLRKENNNTTTGPEISDNKFYGGINPNLRFFGSNIQYVRRRSEKRYNSIYSIIISVSTVKHSGGHVMDWCWISAFGVGILSKLMEI